MRASFGLPDAPVLEVRDLRFGPLAVTEVRYDELNYGQSSPLPAQDALIFSLQLRSSANHDIWEGGRRLPAQALGAGSCVIYDLRQGLIARSAQPFHSLTFNFPLSGVDAAGVEPVTGIRVDRAERSFMDPVLYTLGLSLVPALAEPEHAPRLFVDHVLFAVRSHLTRRFGRGERRAAHTGGLAPWQERRAKELIESRLGADLSLAEVAEVCELSVAQFARAFKRSTGLPPYRYLLERRLERAGELLLFSQLPLADVAISCGFADQSHFTKAFQKRVGTSPGSFRAAVQTPRGKPSAG
jgi:AraC family transcriptional regulator